LSTISIERTKAPKTARANETPAFGTVFTDHMCLIDYKEGKGWQNPRIVPYGGLPTEPASTVLHYGQAIFDGLKGFRGKDGVIRLFRPKMHAERLNRSAEQLCIPPLDSELVYETFLKLVDVDRDWVPSAPGTAIYLRPTVIAAENYLGVRPASSYTYFLILSPVGAYYAEGTAPVAILVEDELVRAAPGGLGAAKTPANYAASLLAAERAKKKGYTQVLWLDAVHRKYLEEVGTMNIMVKIAGEVITPPLGGSILAGVTRDSVLTLLKDWGVKMSERQISIDEVAEAAAKGTLEEMWGTGTAAVVSPVGRLGYKGKDITIAGGKTGPLTQKLYDAITAIQYGTAPDPHGWMVKVG